MQRPRTKSSLGDRSETTKKNNGQIKKRRKMCFVGQIKITDLKKKTEKDGKEENIF